MEFLEEKLLAVVTNAGLDAAINADDLGLKVQVSHIAFGDATNRRYNATASQTSLRRERVRIPVLGGEDISPTEIMVQGLLDTGPQFNINEVGFYDEDGTLIVVWANADFTLATKTPGIPFAMALNLALAGIPPGSVTLNVSGPSINLTLLGSISQIAADFMLTWRVMADGIIKESKPRILQKWR